MGDGPDWTRNYATLLEDLKARVLAVQHRASLAVNRELVLLYWSIGRDILARQAEGVLRVPVMQRQVCGGWSLACDQIIQLASNHNASRAAQPSVGRSTV